MLVFSSKAFQSAVVASNPQASQHDALRALGGTSPTRQLATAPVVALREPSNSGVRSGPCYGRSTSPLLSRAPCLRVRAAAAACRAGALT